MSHEQSSEMPPLIQSAGTLAPRDAAAPGVLVCRVRNVKRLNCRLQYSERVTRKPVDFSALLEQITEIGAWSKKQGITGHGRLHQYAKNIVELQQLHEKYGNTKVIYEAVAKAERLTETLSSYVESLEIVEIISVLREKNIHIPLGTLKKVLTGSPDAATEDASSNAPRNFIFELLVAAFFTKRGFTPNLKVEPDITVEFEGKHILIACKRVFSMAK